MRPFVVQAAAGSGRTKSMAEGLAAKVAPFEVAPFGVGNHSRAPKHSMLATELDHLRLLLLEVVLSYFCLPLHLLFV